MSDDNIVEIAIVNNTIPCTTTATLDIDLLRRQRDWMLQFDGSDEVDGLINLLDSLLDICEGIGPGVNSLCH